MSLPDPFDAPDPTAETLPSTQEPNPYRFTVSVTRKDGNKRWPHTAWGVKVTSDVGTLVFANNAFPTKEEADTHAALILAALHQAVME